MAKTSLVQIGYDYSESPELDSDDLGKLKYIGASMRKHTVTTVRSIIRMGEDVKSVETIFDGKKIGSRMVKFCIAETGHGQSWIYQCLRIFNKFGSNEAALKFPVTALIALSKKDVPDSVCKEALKIASKQQAMTVTQTEECIEKGQQKAADKGTKVKKKTASQKPTKKKPKPSKDAVTIIGDKCANCGCNSYVEDKTFGWVCTQCSTPQGFTKKDLAEPNKAVKKKDDHGTTIPAAVAKLMDDPSVHTHIAALNTIIKWAKGRRNAQAAYLETSVVIDQLETAIERMESSIPHAVCPKCFGKKCTRCRNAGFMPKWDFDEAEQE